MWITSDSAQSANRLSCIVSASLSPQAGSGNVRVDIGLFFSIRARQDPIEDFWLISTDDHSVSAYVVTQNVLPSTNQWIATTTQAMVLLRSIPTIFRLGGYAFIPAETLQGLALAVHILQQLPRSFCSLGSHTHLEPAST